MDVVTAGAEPDGAPDVLSGPARRPRRDAERNRRLLVQAAVEIFRDEGLEVALDAIARRAGVGNATLYRHFPTREDLYEAVFADAAERIAEVTGRYAEVSDARQALHDYVEELYASSPVSSELGKLADERLAVSPALRHIAEEVRGRLARLLALAQQQGTVRRDIDVEDLSLLLTGLKPVVVASSELAPGLWRRQLVFLLDALRPGSAAPLPESGVDTQLRHDVVRAAQCR